MRTVVSMDTQMGSDGRGLGEPTSSGLCGDGWRKRGGGAARHNPIPRRVQPAHAPTGRRGSGPRWVGAALFSLVVRVLRRVERQGGFRGA
jgi:hypothetical protein